MFDILKTLGAALGEKRRRKLRAKVAETLRANAPHGVSVREVEEGVLLVGRGLLRRSIVDPALRWIAGRLR